MYIASDMNRITPFLDIETYAAAAFARVAAASVLLLAKRKCIQVTSSCGIF